MASSYESAGSEPQEAQELQGPGSGPGWCSRCPFGRVATMLERAKVSPRRRLDLMLFDQAEALEDYAKMPKAKAQELPQEERGKVARCVVLMLIALAQVAARVGLSLPDCLERIYCSDTTNNSNPNK